MTRLIVAAEMAFGLVWCLVQQICYIQIKRAYDRAAGRSSGGLFLAVQAAVALAIVAICVMQGLGVGSFADLPSWVRYAPQQPGWSAWTVTICTAMICFDALLVLYARRWARLCDGAGAVRTLWADAAVIAISFGFGALYLVSSDFAAASLRVSLDGYHTLRRAYIAMANGCYIALELWAAWILRGFWLSARRIRSEEAG